MKAILIISHGSRSPRTKEEIVSLVRLMRERMPKSLVEYAFLEIELPSIPEGIDQCVSNGASEVIITLNFLNSGRHVNEDIPSIVKEAQKRYPQVKFSITRPIGQHAQIPDLFVDLINET